MKFRRKNFLNKKISPLFLSIVILFSGFFANVKNVQAETLSIVNLPKGAIVEHLKLSIPTKFKKAWLKAEKRSWEPWLSKQNGFLGRQLFWDPKLEEATLLISWETRSVWKSISQSEINLVQQDFEEIARKETGITNGNPFPLIYEGELTPQ